MAKPKTTKREQQRMETRQKIYDIAMDLFSRKGYTRVSIDDICEKAGVSRGTFYYYFKSKDQVFLEEFLKIDQFYLDSMEELARKHKSPLKQITALIGLSFDYINNLGVKIIRVLYHGEIDPARKKQAMSSPRRPIYDIIERLVRAAQEQGELRGDMSVEGIAEFLFRGYRGVIYEWCIQSGKFDLITAGNDFIRAAIEGLSKR